MAKTLAPWAQKIIQARSRASEVEVRDEIEKRRWKWEQIDLQGKNVTKRPEGCIHIGGAAAVLVEVKHVHSGGMASDGTVVLSDLDPDLVNAGVKEFSAIPPAIERNLDDAELKRRDLVTDRSEYRDLPYVVFFYSSEIVSLKLVDRRMPHRRDISGVVYIERGRLFREALDAMPVEEFERRMSTNDVTDLSDPGLIEWRFVANPYALRAVPKTFRESCLIGWPGEVAWPESMPPEKEEAALESLAALMPQEKLGLKVAYHSFGRVDANDQNLQGGMPLFDRLVTLGLATQGGRGKYELNTDGLRLGLVAEAHGIW